MEVVIIVLIIILALAIILALLFHWYSNHFFKKLGLLYKEAVSKEVVIEKGLLYKNSDKQNLKMDIYRPGGKYRNEKVPVIILLHGEGIERLLKDVKEWSIYTAYGRVIADKGYAAVTFHRNRTNLNFNHSEVAQDILDAVAYVRKNADRWNLDANRICIWSFSLGGIYQSLFLKDTPEYIRCHVSYYGLLDVKYRVKNLKEEHKVYCPENYLPKNGKKVSPLLIVKAKNDKIRGVNASQDHFMQVAKSRNIPYEFILHSTGGHTFDALNDNEETQEVMEKTWEFIQRNL